MRIVWEVYCDGCGMVKTTDAKLTQDFQERFKATSIWQPGYPPGWIPFDDGKRIRFFHNRACNARWLKAEGKPSLEKELAA